VKSFNMCFSVVVWLCCRNVRASSVLLLDLLFVPRKLLNGVPTLSCIMLWSSGRVCRKHR